MKSESFSVAGVGVHRYHSHISNQNVVVVCGRKRGAERYVTTVAWLLGM